MRFFWSILVVFLTACQFSSPIQQEVFLAYRFNKQQEPYFYLSEKTLETLRHHHIVPVLTAQYADLKWLCPTCQLNINNPTIGILLARDDTEADAYALPANYVYPLIKAGANVRFITYENIASQVQNLDGILLPGGSFASHGKWYLSYGEKKFDKAGARYYAYEYLIEYARKKQMPLLGICAGMQMMSALLSDETIKFYDEVGEVSDTPHSQLDKYQRAHTVTINPDSILYQILKVKKLGVNSRHHVGIVPETTQDSSKIIVGAVAPDRIIEATEFPSFPNALGVQFHPEVFAMQNDKTMQKIFTWFVEQAHIYQQKGIAK